MIIKKGNISKRSLIIILTGFFVSFFPTSATQAYTCDYSGKNGSGKEGQYKLEQEGVGGSCYYMSPDQKDNSKKKAVVQNGQIVAGQFTCTDGTVLQGEDCYTFKKVYTAYKPTYDDGTEISNQAFQNACQDQPTYYGMHYNYDPKLNACSAGIGCMSLLGDSGKDRAAGGPTGLPIGDCRRVGAGTSTAGDVLGDDPTTEKVKECTNAGASFNAQTHQCNWTEQTCSAKNGGQGIWTNGQCKAFSDFTNKEDCVKVGGEFKQDPSDPNRWECVKKGTEVNGKVNDVAGDTVGNLGDKVSGKCGKASTNLVNCKTDPTNPLGVLSDVLKIGTQALSVLVGVLSVGGIAWASIKYAKAEDNDNDVKEAKDLIRNIIVGLILYIFMIALINWLVPGGVIG